MHLLNEILRQEKFSKEEITGLLRLSGEKRELLLKHSRQIKTEYIGNTVYFRGLIEFSNVCAKNCFYCGIRKENSNVVRYNASDDEILDACRFAWENRFGSVVLQSGEISTKAFVLRIEKLLRKISQLSNNELGITLSCGEQTRETYQRWFESGAHRYLLRIESSNRDLYYRIHPHNEKHSFEKRLEALHFLRETGYQLGTGVMIGLPFQTIEDLADDLLFFQKLDIDMCGMGPYIEHENTPLSQHREFLLPLKQRFELALTMIAVLRLMMPDINIAASTALQTIDPEGRIKALNAGANIVMPNITPTAYRSSYLLYDGKPCLDENAEITSKTLAAKIEAAGYEIGFGVRGDSKHFFYSKKGQSN